MDKSCHYSTFIVFQFRKNILKYYYPNTILIQKIYNKSCYSDIISKYIYIYIKCFVFLHKPLSKSYSFNNDKIERHHVSSNKEY